MIGLNLRPWVPHMHCFKTDDAATVPGCHRSRLDDECSPIHTISLAKSSSTVRTGSNKQRRNFLHMVLLKDKAVKALSDYHHERKISRLTIER